MSRALNWFVAITCLPLLAGCFGFPASPPRVMEVNLADLDGNGTLDAVLANGRFGEPYTYPKEIQYQILFNDGEVNFSRQGQLPEIWNNTNVALDDLNGDGAIDIVIGGSSVLVYDNDGRGIFDNFKRLPESVDTAAHRGGIALADLNNDGYLDIFKANCCGGVAFGQEETWLLKSHNFVWLNDGYGNFHNTGQLIGELGSNHVALGDLNGNGYPDAFVVNGQTQMNIEDSSRMSTPNEVWFNDGQGFFSNSGQWLGLAESFSVALGDINGNGFLDAAVGNNGNDEIWLNDGSGFFMNSNQSIDNDLTRRVFLADLNGNGYLDLFTAGETTGRIWFNDGMGNFTADTQQFSYGQYDAVALGDLNNNGSIDIFVAGINDYQIWLNDGNGQFLRLHPTGNS
jgi:hypothetical protein